MDGLSSEPVLSGYHLLPTVRGDLLAKLGRDEEARAEFERARFTHPELPRAGRFARADGQLLPAERRLTARHIA